VEHLDGLLLGEGHGCSSILMEEGGLGQMWEALQRAL
jgi:hypothetical protein